MSNPILSVIISTYNCKKYLTQAIKSVCLQPCKDLELIVIDDGSTDGTEKVVKELCSDYPYIIYKKLRKNGGVSRARNIGLDLAKGKYIAFLDADDILVKGFYDNRLQKILREKNIDMYKFAIISAAEDLRVGLRHANSHNKLCYQNEEVKKEIENSSFTQFLYKREIIGKNIRFLEDLALGEDIVFLNRVTCKVKMLKCQKRFMYIVRIRKDSASRSKRVDPNQCFFAAKRIIIDAKNLGNADWYNMAAWFGMIGVHNAIEQGEPICLIERTIEEYGIKDLFYNCRDTNGELYIKKYNRIKGETKRYILQRKKDRIINDFVNKIVLNKFIRNLLYFLKGGKMIKNYIEKGVI